MRSSSCLSLSLSLTVRHGLGGDALGFKTSFLPSPTSNPSFQISEDKLLTTPRSQSDPAPFQMSNKTLVPNTSITAQLNLEESTLAA